MARPPKRLEFRTHGIIVTGLRNAKLKGKTLGRPPLLLDCARIARLRAAGASIRPVSEQMEVSTATIHKVVHRR